MPAKSKKQKRFFGAVMGAKTGSENVSGAAKQVAKTMSKKKIKEFLTTKESQMDETSLLKNTDILTESQKEALKGIIDQLVEERVREKNDSFIKNYTSFIVEQATRKLSSTFMSKITNRIHEEIQNIQTKADKICRSVVLESSSKVSEIKKKHAAMVEEFKNEAPKLIENLAEKRAEELAEDAIIAIQQNEKLATTVEGITKGLERLGFVINEDTDGRVKGLQHENKELKTRLIKQERDLKLAQLCEGMLPSQKKEMSELLSECTTAKILEEKFSMIKTKVMNKDVIVEEKKIEPKKVQVINEEDVFADLIAGSKKFIKKS